MDNKQRFGFVMAQRMSRSASSAVSVVAELGLINGDMSLSVDSISTPIPSSQYMVDLTLTHENYYSYNELNSSANAPHHHDSGEHAQEGGSGHHTHDDGLHDHRVPSVFRCLKPGDRVLVLWCGFEPVVSSIVVPADTVTRN